MHKGTMMENVSGLWGTVMLGGPLFVLGVFVWVKVQTASRTRDDDPAPSLDNPPNGMNGHD